MSLRDAVQELRELGIRGAAFRAAWEVRTRIPSVRRSRVVPAGANVGTEWTSHLPLEDPVTLARWMRPLIPEESLQELRERADSGSIGKIHCFGRHVADFGWPINWHRNPTTGLSWSADDSWAESLANSTPGDVKDCWEIARFPHAYHLARAASFQPAEAERYATALVGQIGHFIEQNPPGRGIHWASGQEVGFRLLAWLFALDVLLLRTRAGQAGVPMVQEALILGAAEIERHLDYARIAVYNNHLLSEALALFGVGALLPDHRDGIRWRELGRRLLDEQAAAQFYSDGAYIQQSHNYHRVALHDYLWACLFARSMGDSPSASWIAALERSLDFLFAQQNPLDGRLPNYGANDGAHPSLLSTCDFSDMRPVLQVVSLLVRGERLYAPGPWDEMTAWFLGARSLDAPARASTYPSRSFAATGYHVARDVDPSTFATFRCGTLRDRFSQIDMLHLDVWWKGYNVLVDPGSFRYNAADEWHDHFTRTGSHNTIVVDGHDQMLHYRRFKVLYWTKAKTIRFEVGPNWTVMEGEHYGFRRRRGNVVHRRAVLQLAEGGWIVVDSVRGIGRHTARLHWLGGVFPWADAQQQNGFDLQTPDGTFELRVVDGAGRPVAMNVRAGVEPSATTAPRGWLSRYYGERVPVPSGVSERDGLTPMTFVTLLGSDVGTPEVSDTGWSVKVSGRDVRFKLVDGLFEEVLTT